MDTNTALRGNTHRYVVLTLRKNGTALDFSGGVDLICAAGVTNLVHNYRSSEKDATFALVASEDPNRLYNRLTRNGISIVDSRIVDTELDSVQVYNALDSALKAGLPRNDIRYLEEILHSEVPSTHSKPGVDERVIDERVGFSIFNTEGNSP